MSDRSDSLVFRTIIPSHHLFWAIKLDDDDTAREAPTLDGLGLTARPENVPRTFPPLVTRGCGMLRMPPG